MTLEEFVLVTATVLGGPLGILRWYVEKRFADLDPMILHGSILTVATVLCFVIGHFLAPALTFFQIAAAAPGVIGGASFMKGGGVPAMKAASAPTVKYLSQKLKGTQPEKEDKP